MKTHSRLQIVKDRRRAPGSTPYSLAHATQMCDDGDDERGEADAGLLMGMYSQPLLFIN